MIEPPPGLDHVRDGVLHSQPHAAQIDPYHPFEALEGKARGQVGLALDTGVVVQHVELAEAFDGLLDHLFRVGGIGDIGAHAERLTTAAVISLATSSAAASSMSTTATAAPSAANSSAAALPIPEPAPVINATLSVSLISGPSAGGSRTAPTHFFELILRAKWR